MSYNTPMRVAVIGPQNSGKSTFIKDFLEAFPSFSSPTKTYRELVTDKGLPLNLYTTEESQVAIRDFLYAQLRDTPGRRVLFDRCVIDNYIYTKAQHERGLVPEAFLEETEAVMRDSLRYHDAILFIPAAVGVPLIDDGVRNIRREFVDRVNTLFIETLLRLRSDIPHPIHTISGTREERVRRAQSALSLMPEMVALKKNAATEAAA
jgi:nicotinamide riboside kinase